MRLDCINSTLGVVCWYKMREGDRFLTSLLGGAASCETCHGFYFSVGVAARTGIRALKRTGTQS